MIIFDKKTRKGAYRVTEYGAYNMLHVVCIRFWHAAFFEISCFSKSIRHVRYNLTHFCQNFSIFSLLDFFFVKFDNRRPFQVGFSTFIVDMVYIG